MATQTTNYHLTKPGSNDPVDISVLNDNFDAIDKAIPTDEHINTLIDTKLGATVAGNTHVYDIGSAAFDIATLDFSTYDAGDVILVVSDMEGA